MTDLGKFNKSFEQLETDDETKGAQVACRMSVEEQIERLAMAFVDGKEEDRRNSTTELTFGPESLIPRISTILTTISPASENLFTVHHTVIFAPQKGIFFT